MYKFLLDAYENTFAQHPILSSLVVLYVSFHICWFVYSSVSQWNLHPVQVSCSIGTNKCVVNTYSYEHSFCWYDLFDRMFSKHHSRTRSESCTLPRIKSSTKNDIVFTDIADVKVKQVGKVSHIVLVMKDNTERDIYDTETATYANKMAKELKSALDMCLNADDSSLNELIDYKCEPEVWIGK